MRAIGKSEIGMCRTKNEDAIFISDDNFPFKDLFIVADGMGGYNAGEVASASAIQAFLGYVKKEWDITEKKAEVLDFLVEGVSVSNHAVYHKSKESEEFAEMGTTFVVATIQEHKLFVAYVGDSRVYVLREDELRQITTDHSYVMELVKMGNITMEEAAVHPQRNIITRAVGTKKTVEADTSIEDLQDGDMILMCSDGLSTMLTDTEMKDILKKGADLEARAQELVDCANKKGGHDNISLVLIEE